MISSDFLIRNSTRDVTRLLLSDELRFRKRKKFCFFIHVPVVVQIKNITSFFLAFTYLFGFGFPVIKSLTKKVFLYYLVGEREKKPRREILKFIPVLLSEAKATNDNAEARWLGESV